MRALSKDLAQGSVLSFYYQHRPTSRFHTADPPLPAIGLLRSKDTGFAQWIYCADNVNLVHSDQVSVAQPSFARTHLRSTSSRAKGQQRTTANE